MDSQLDKNRDTGSYFTVLIESVRNNIRIKTITNVFQFPESLIIAKTDFQKEHIRLTK